VSCLLTKRQLRIEGGSRMARAASDGPGAERGEGSRAITLVRGRSLSRMITLTAIFAVE
jgi:hypothetical protein